MVFFGDVSGHLRGLLSGDVAVCVVAVVGGDRTDVYRCPKQCVRRVRDVSEARWADLTGTQKRRVIDCLADHSTDLDFGIAAFRHRDLTGLDKSYRLHQNVSFPPDWDLALTADTYAELLSRLGDKETRIEFDRVASISQSDAVADRIEAVTGATAEHDGSSRNPGVQAADCLAGAAAESLTGQKPWLDRLDVIRAGSPALDRLEALLNEV